MKRLLFILSLTLSFSSIFCQIPASYNQFKVVTNGRQIADHIKNTPSEDPIYLVLAPGIFRVTATITIDRIGAVYIHGLSTAGTQLTDSTGFVGNDLFVVKRTQKFSLAGLTLGTSKSFVNDLDAWRGCTIRFETNPINQPHDVEIQEIEQRSSIRINAPGNYRVQSSRVPNWGYILNHPNADLVITQAHSWVYLGNYPKPKSTGGNFIDNYSLTHPDDIAFVRDSACVVWQRQGRVRIYNTNNVMSGCAYEYRFDSKSHLGPHIIAGLRNEIEANNYPSWTTCIDDKRVFKALVKVAGDGNEIIFKGNSPVKAGPYFDGICAERLALVDFQSKDGKAFILGNANKEGINKLIINSANTNLGNAQIVLLGNKIASLPAYPDMSTSTSIPQNLYADVSLGSGNKIYNMGNMTRLNTGLHPQTGKYLTGEEAPTSYGDEVFSDLFLSNTDSLRNAPAIPQDLPPRALTLPKFRLAYNASNPSDPLSNHELLWRKILINVRNYGAIPNDNKDDHEGIQLAVDKAALSNGLLYFPEGQYDISSSIEFNTLSNLPPLTASTADAYGSQTNTLASSGRSILIAGADESTTLINGLGSVLRIFSITNSRLSRMQGLTLRVNQGNIKAIRGVTNTNNPTQSIVDVDNFGVCGTIGITPQYGSIYLWNFRDCNFVGGQVGVATQMRKQMSGSVRNHRTGSNVEGIFSGRFQDAACNNPAWGGLGESFALINCKFQKNNIGFVTAHHQAFCHFVSDCLFELDTFGIAQYGARGADHFRGQTGFTADNAGGNFTVLHTQFNSHSRDFFTAFQTQTVGDYFNSCTFNAPTAILCIGDNYPSLQNSWLTTYRRNKNYIEFVENCVFNYDHTQDALYKYPALPNDPTVFEALFKRFTFVAQNMSSIFCLNSDLSKTTFLKAGTAPLEASPANNTANLQGVGYGMIAQCILPGFPGSTFSPYGTKIAAGFNFSPSKSNVAKSNPPYPQGYGTTPPLGLYTPQYFPKEIVKLDLNNPQATNDYYFWRINTFAVGGLVSRNKDFALPMQRILLYNAGSITTPTVTVKPEVFKLEVFPNPVDQVLTINVNMKLEKQQQADLVLLDLLGRVIVKKIVYVNQGANSFSMDLSQVQAGVYFVRVGTHAYKGVTRKVIKY